MDLPADQRNRHTKSVELERRAETRDSTFHSNQKQNCIRVIYTVHVLYILAGQAHAQAQAVG